MSRTGNGMFSNYNSSGRGGGFFSNGGGGNTSMGRGGGGMFSNRNNNNNNQSMARNGGFFNSSSSNNNGNNTGHGGFFNNNSSRNQGKNGSSMFNNSNNNGPNGNGNQEGNMMGVNPNGLNHIAEMMSSVLQAQQQMFMINMATSQSMKKQPTGEELNYLVRTKGEGMAKTEIELQPYKNSYDYYLQKNEAISRPSVPINPQFSRNLNYTAPAFNSIGITYDPLEVQRRKEAMQILKQSTSWCDIPLDPLDKLGINQPTHLNHIYPQKKYSGVVKSRKNNMFHSMAPQSTATSARFKPQMSPISPLQPIKMNENSQRGTIKKETKQEPLYFKLKVWTQKQSQIIARVIKVDMIPVTTIKHFKQAIFHDLFDAPEECASTEMNLWNENDCRLPDRAYVHLYIKNSKVMTKWELFINTSIAMKSLSRESIELGLRQGEVGIRALNVIPFDSDLKKIEQESISDWGILGESADFDQIDQIKPEKIFKTPPQSHYLQESLSVIKSAQIRTPITDSEKMMTLPQLSDLTTSQKKAVENFMIYNRFGSVLFHKPVDVSELKEIEGVVNIALHSIEIMEGFKQAKGEGFNQPCTLKLIDWYNQNGTDAYGNDVSIPGELEKSSLFEIEEKRKQAFQDKMKKMAKKMKGAFIEFNREDNVVEIELDWLDAHA